MCFSRRVLSFFLRYTNIHSGLPIWPRNVFFSTWLRHSGPGNPSRISWPKSFFGLFWFFNFTPLCFLVLLVICTPFLFANSRVIHRLVKNWPSPGTHNLTGKLLVYSQ